jgi:hypothetical protein
MSATPTISTFMPLAAPKSSTAVGSATAEVIPSTAPRGRRSPTVATRAPLFSDTGAQQIEGLAPTRRPLVCSCTAVLLMAEYEEMGFMNPLQGLGRQLRLLLMRLDQACEELCFFIAINA